MLVSGLHCSGDADFLLRSQKGTWPGLIDSLCLASHTHALLLCFCADIYNQLETRPVSAEFLKYSLPANRALAFLAFQAPSARHSASDTMPLFAVNQLAACQCTKLLVQLARRALLETQSRAV